jgi:hypothetical protein
MSRIDLANQCETTWKNFDLSAAFIRQTNATVLLTDCRPFRQAPVKPDGALNS